MARQSAGRAVSTMRSASVQVGRLRLNHTYGGNGSPPVVLIHGLGSSGYIEWRFNLAALSRRNSTYAPDLPGFGQSDKPRARYGVPLFTRAVQGYMAALGLENAVVVGASLGGRIALQLALDEPQLVRKLVLVNSLGLGRPQLQPIYPLLTLPQVGETMLRMIREALHRAHPALIRRVAARYIGMSGDLERTLNDAYLADLREMYAAKGYPAAYLATVRSLVTKEALQGAHDLSPMLERIHAPLLIVWGDQDPLFPLEHAHRAHAMVPGSRLAVIEGAGHTPQAERPDEFNRALASFIEA